MSIKVVHQDISDSELVIATTDATGWRERIEDVKHPEEDSRASQTGLNSGFEGGFTLGGPSAGCEPSRPGLDQAPADPGSYSELYTCDHDHMHSHGN